MASFDDDKAQCFTAEVLLLEFYLMRDSNNGFIALDAHTQALDAIREELDGLAENRCILKSLTDLHFYSQTEFQVTLFCAWFSYCLALSANLAKQARTDLFLGAMMQDLGKVQDLEGLSSWVKHKPNSLAALAHARNVGSSDAHPLVSASLAEMLFPEHQSLHELILKHHVRADGAGYPEGVSEAQVSDTEALLIVSNAFAAHWVKSGEPSLQQAMDYFRVSAFQGFSKANNLAFNLIKQLTAIVAQDGDSTLLATNTQGLDAKLSELQAYTAELLMLSAALIPFEHNSLVIQARKAIERFVFTCNESGLLSASRDFNKQDIGSTELSELASLLDCLAPYVIDLGWRLSELKQQRALGIDDELLQDRISQSVHCARALGAQGLNQAML